MLLCEHAYVCEKDKMWWFFLLKEHCSGRSYAGNKGDGWDEKKIQDNIAMA